MTRVTEFLLLGSPDKSELQMLQFVLFLLIYLTALLGNLVLIAIITLDIQLHTPMFFFLANLSILDICYISVTVPKSMNVSLTNVRTISFSGCMAQIFLGLTFGSAELSLLTVMAYDRYSAICYPLHYHVIMSKVKCSNMVAGCWLCSIAYAVLHTLNIIRLPFCGPNTITQLFCEIPQLLKLAWSDILGIVITNVVCGVVFGLVFCSLITVSYFHIFSTVLKIPSSQGKDKAFSTCLPHLMVICLFMVTGMFTYLKSSSESSLTEDILAGVLYSVVSPIANPVIYSLRNKNIRKTLVQFFKKVIYTKNVPL